jgi:hypothetical protein
VSKIFSLSLYHTSFVPLWISICFIDLKSILEKSPDVVTEIVSISTILITLLISFFVLLFALSVHGKDGTIPLILVSATEEKSITAEYLLSYILPLFAFDFTQWSQVVLFLIFYLMLGFLCVRHNYFSVNILLEINNFRFYNCRLKNEDGKEIEKIIISHRRLNGCIGDILYTKSINNEYKLDVKQ